MVVVIAHADRPTLKEHLHRLARTAFDSTCIAWSYIRSPACWVHTVLATNPSENQFGIRELPPMSYSLGTFWRDKLL